MNREEIENIATEVVDAVLRYIRLSDPDYWKVRTRNV